MNPIKLILFLLLISCNTYITFSQNAKNQELINKALVTETLENQFKTLTSKSNDFREFKNIKHFNLNKFKKNFFDSIAETKKKFDGINAVVVSQKNEINQLKTTVKKASDDFTEIKNDKDSIKLLGISLSKGTYKTILWSIILGLLVSTFFFLFRFKKSNGITKHAKLSLKEVEEEFEQHRKNSLEREQVLRRKLQDEVNKQRKV